VHMLLAEDDQFAIAEAEPAAKAYRYNLAAPRRLEAERGGLPQFVGRPLGEASRPAGPDRHRAVEERRDLDASLQALAKEEREQRDTRRRAPGGIPGFVVGTPDTVRPYFEEYATTGADYMVLSFQWGSLNHEQAMRTIRLFTEELMPSFGVEDPCDFSLALRAAASA